MDFLVICLYLLGFALYFVCWSFHATLNERKGARARVHRVDDYGKLWDYSADKNCQ